jgi:hypothetical protein
MGNTGPSDRSRAVTLALGGLFGFVGAHRFYVGKTGSGILQICTLGGLGVWWMADVILIAAGSFRDVHGRRVKYWTEDEAEYHSVAGGADADRQLPSGVMEEIDSLRAEVADLSERMDFTERLLTQRRHTGALEAGRITPL